MNLNKQNDFNNLLLQKRERRMSEISNNQQIETDNIYKEETDSTKPSTKNSENKILYLKGRNVSHTELKNNQEFNIIPPTVKISNSRKMSSNSLDSRTVCNCKNSQCLKLYCECFSTMSYCDPKLCSCKNCMNTVENEDTRKNAINNYLLKSPSSFKKIFTSQIYSYNNNININSISDMPNISNLDVGISVIRSCTCKKSNCLKRYCECYQSGLSCNSQCKCLSCKNKKSEKVDENLINPQKQKLLFKNTSNISAVDRNNSSSNYKLSENNHKIMNGFIKNENKFKVNEHIIECETQTKQNLDHNNVNSIPYSYNNNNIRLSSDDCNFINNCNNSNLLSLNLNISNQGKINHKNKNKNFIFDKIFFKRKKEEITPYKIIINDYVIKKEYEIDNNL